MSATASAADGICILSFDSGGPGTYSQLVILKEYMSRLADDMGISEEDVYPADYFDLIGGVGFGGLVALMLGHLRMNVAQATDSLLEVVSAVFPEDSQEAPNPKENSRRLKGAIEEVLQASGLPSNAKMKELGHQQTACKVVLYATTSTDTSHPHVFRTYSSRGSSLNLTIVEVICSTISVPSHFDPVIIGSRLTQKMFVGGPFGSNNPTRELLKEAGAAFGNEKRVAQIISIGCGISSVLPLEADSDEAGAGRLLQVMAADCQLVARELEARLFNVEAYHRFNVVKGVDNMELDDWSVLGGIETHTRKYIEADTVTKALDVSLRSLRSKVGTTTLGRINQSSGIKVAAKTAPPVSPFYVARPKPTGIMIHHLITSPSSQQKIFPITGMGGSGKTQLVSYFLQEYSSLFTHVVFVDATSSSSVEADVQTWSRALGDGHEQDVWEDGLRFLSNTPTDTRQALIFDNADDTTLKLAPFIPKNNNVTVIITSRNRDVGSLSTTHHLELGEMEFEEALETLMHAARREFPLSAEELEKAHALMKELGYLAVALVQAGAYCHQLSSYRHGVLYPYSFGQYLVLFSTHRPALMKKGQPSPLDRYERGVYTTLDLSYKIIPQASREFLHFLSFFHHTNIPIGALTKAAMNHFEDKSPLLPRPEDHTTVITDLEKLLCVDGKWSELQVQETIRNLRSFSLVSVITVGDSLFLQLHPLVQAWSRDTVSLAQHYRAMAMQTLTSCHGKGTFLLYRHILPHVLDILSQFEIQNIHLNDLMATGEILEDQGHYQTAGRLFGGALDQITTSVDSNKENKLTVTASLAKLYWSEGRWGEAEKLMVEVLEQRRRVLGTEHPHTIRAVGNLASTYRSQGRWIDAEKLDVEVLEQRRRVLRMEHPDTIQAAANLALTYHFQGRWSQAEKLEVEVLEQTRRVLGMEHPDTIRAAANLATTYLAQGRQIEAEKLEVEVLEQRGRVLGMDHPDTILAAANLAATYHSQGWWSQAEKLEVEVLEQTRRVLGMEHPDTIRAAANLATTYWAQGRQIEAEKLAVEVLEQRRRVLGMEHPDTILAAANLAATYHSQGWWSQAEKLEVEVLEQTRRVLGMEHPDTITAAGNLATTYQSQGRWIEAEKLGVEVLEQRRRVLGMEHPDTMLSAGNLASTYHSQGRWSEAEKLMVEVLEQTRKVLGMEHADTIRAAANLASTYHSQGRWNEAEKLEVEVHEQRRRVLGMEHPDTIRAAANLASTYHSQGRWNEAEKLEVEVLEQGRRVLGMEHPDTIRVAANLASTCRSQGRWIEAEKLEVEVLEQRRRVLVMEHPDTIRAAANLALTYHSQGRWDEAEKLMVEVLEQTRRILGMEHPDTIRAAANLASTYSSQDRWSEAEMLEVEVLEQRGRLLGTEHPDTILAAANLAATYRMQDRWDETLELLEPALKLGMKVFGRMHPSIQVIVRALAVVYERLARSADAETTKDLLLSRHDSSP